MYPNPKEEGNMSTIIIEIRSGEGGNDAKMLVREQMALYVKYAMRNRL